MGEWVLFKKDNGRIGVLPAQHKSLLKGDIIETVSGTFADACNRCTEIEDKKGD